MNDFIHSRASIPREIIDDGEPLRAGDVFEVMPDGSSRRVSYADLPEEMKQMVDDARSPLEPDKPMPEPPTDFKELGRKVGDDFRRLKDYYARKVQGRCPSCNSETLFLAPSGHVTCSLDRCDDPDAASILLEPEESLPVYDGFTLFMFDAGSAVHRFYSQTAEGCVDLLAAYLREQIDDGWSYTFILEQGRLDLSDLAGRRKNN